MNKHRPTNKYRGLVAVSSLVLLAGTVACSNSGNEVEKNAEQAPVAKNEAVQLDALAEVEARNKIQQTDTTAYITNNAATVSGLSFMPEPVITVDTTAKSAEHYLKTTDNPVKQVAAEPVSTFSVDVDTGSYSNTRRMLNKGVLPPKDAIREEAFINYFNYAYTPPKSTVEPFSMHTELATAPWNKHRQLLKIGLKGYEVEKSSLKSANLVFLLDVSGSMNAANKLPLLKSSLKMLVKQLDENDSVAIVVYAGAAGVVLPATKGSEHQVITSALTKLAAGGSTNGEQGIALAYQLAEENFKTDGVNRVILATDGDFNVGMQSLEQLKQLIAQKRKTGIALTTLGFGEGNYNDALMEQLANIGNGQHAYIDTLNEARKVLVDELSSTMQIIAKDVKIQVEFNPQQVAEYRLIGYQNRLLANEDFNNDKVDAAEIGAGHTVTALYELTLANAEQKQIDELRYQDQEKPSSKVNDELAFVKVRYKQPSSEHSALLSYPIKVPHKELSLSTASQDFRFAAAVAGFAQLLRGGKYTQNWDYAACAELAMANKGADLFGYRSEFVQLVKNTAALSDYGEGY